VNFWKRFSQLNARQLYRFALLFLSQPLLIVPVLTATLKTFSICNSLYGNAHQGNGKANGFRHALWNALVCKNSYRFIKNKQKTVFFAQELTDLYENVTKNEILDRTMDLHNNMLGRVCFLNYLDKKNEEMIEFLQKKAEISKFCTKIEEINIAENQIVYISED